MVKRGLLAVSLDTHGVRKGMALVIVLAWIGQIVLFFIAWRVLHWLASNVRQSAQLGIWAELVVNLLLAIILLIVVTNVGSPWWLMILIGAVIGVITGFRSGSNAA